MWGFPNQPRGLFYSSRRPHRGWNSLQLLPKPLTMMNTITNQSVKNTITIWISPCPSTWWKMFTAETTAALQWQLQQQLLQLLLPLVAQTEYTVQHQCNRSWQSDVEVCIAQAVCVPSWAQNERARLGRAKTSGPVWSPIVYRFIFQSTNPHGT